MVDEYGYPNPGFPPFGRPSPHRSHVWVRDPVEKGVAFTWTCGACGASNNSADALQVCREVEHSAQEVGK